MQGKALREWRHGNDWTLDQAAKILGTTQTTVYRWESGRHRIPQGINILVMLLTDDKINIRKVQSFLFKRLDE